MSDRVRELMDDIDAFENDREGPRKEIERIMRKYEFPDEPERPPIGIALVFLAVATALGFGLHALLTWIVPVSLAWTGGTVKFWIIAPLAFVMAIGFTRGELRWLYRLLIVVAWAFVLAMFVR